MDLVADCSFTAALFLPDESSTAADEAVKNIKESDTIWVPGLWWHETANVLAMAAKRKRLTEADTMQVMQLLNGLDITTDSCAGTAYLARLYNLAAEHGLTAYDAAYLELAIRKNARLASYDKILIKAAVKIGVTSLISQNPPPAR